MIHSVPFLLYNYAHTMAIPFLKTLLSILVWWVWIFAAISGLGLLFRRIFGLKTITANDWLNSFWSGWAIAIVFLQLWHLWSKIDLTALVLISLAGALGLFCNRANLWNLIRRILKNKLLSLAFLSLFALWLSDLAIGPIQNTDTGLYHLQNTMWASAYPIIPGLGNLHLRFGYNSSYFLYTALLNVGPWTGQPHHLANGLFLLVLAVQILLSFSALTTDSNRSPRIDHFFRCLLLAPVITQILGENLTSLSPDLPLYVLGIVIASELLRFIVQQNDSISEERFSLVFITLLASAGIAIKISFSVFAATAFLIALSIWFHRNQTKNAGEIRKTLAWVGLCGALLLGPWALRGVISTGYLAFPIQQISFPVAWRTPSSIVVYEANAIRAYARKPVIQRSDKVLGTWTWLQPWFDELSSEVRRPLQMAFIALAILAFSPRLKPQKDRKNHTWLFLLPALIGVGFWFLSAPAYRFAGAMFWIIAAGLLALAFDQLGFLSRLLGTKISLTFCLIFFLFVSPFQNPIFMGPYDDTTVLYPVPHPDYETKYTDSGIEIHITNERDQCWDIPLPCTPYFYKNLNLLKPGDLSSGFWLAPDTKALEY